MVCISRVHTLTELCAEEIGRLLKQQSPGSTDIEIPMSELLESLQNPNFHMYIAKDGGSTLCGMGTIFFQKNARRWIAEIHDIVVDEPRRGEGIGKRIVHALICKSQEFSTEKGKPLKLYLTSRPSRVAANALYLQMGFILVAQAVGEKGTNLYKMMIYP